MTLRPLLSTLALTGALALAACGGNDETTAASEEQTTPEQAIAEIGAVRDSLDRAVQAVKDGDAGRADEILADGYVEHFELVEGPLEEVDAELNEELEEALSHDIREQVKGGASAKEVEALVDDVKADLETAERKLR